MSNIWIHTVHLNYPKRFWFLYSTVKLTWCSSCFWVSDFRPLIWCFVIAKSECSRWLYAKLRTCEAKKEQKWIVTEGAEILNTFGIRMVGTWSVFQWLTKWLPFCSVLCRHTATQVSRISSSQPSGLERNKKLLRFEKRSEWAIRVRIPGKGSSN